MANEFENLLLHKQTRVRAQQFVARPAHALLLIGPLGSGKSTLAVAMGAEILGMPLSNLESYPYFSHIRREKNRQDISIEAIRNLINTLRLKTTGKTAIRRVVLIEDAHTMSLEAQNALLKALEEPSLDTVFILTAPYERSLLPTMVSRTQQLSINPISPKEASEYFKSYPRAKIESAWQLSQGGVGLLAALLNEDKGHPLKEAVDQAKNLLRAKPYERLLALEGFNKDKVRLAQLLDALDRVITALLHSALNTDKKSQAASLLKSRRLIYELQLALEANASPRLVILQLVMNLAV